MGKQLIIVGADFSAVSIDSRQQVPITVPTSLTISDVGGTASLSYSSTVSVAQWDITSNNTSVATVANSGNPRTITGTGAGSTIISVTATPTDTTTYRPTTKTVALTVSSVTPGDYTITTSVTYGSYTGATTISPNGTATVTITANTNYTLPSSVTVNGATQSYNSTTGVISLSNPTSNVTITAVCQSSTPSTGTWLFDTLGGAGTHDDWVANAALGGISKDTVAKYNTSSTQSLFSGHTVTKIGIRNALQSGGVFELHTADLDTELTLAGYDSTPLATINLGTDGAYQEYTVNAVIPSNKTLVWYLHGAGSSYKAQTNGSSTWRNASGRIDYAFLVGESPSSSTALTALAWSGMDFMIS